VEVPIQEEENMELGEVSPPHPTWGSIMSLPSGVGAKPDEKWF